MTHDLPTADLATLSDTAFWANYHAAASARDHSVWAACGREFARRYALVGDGRQVPVEEFHARLGPKVYHLWETAQTLYRGLPEPPLRTDPLAPDEIRRYGPGPRDAGPNLVWIDGPEFDAEVLAVSGRVVVLFWAAWSSPDHMLFTWLRDHAADWPGLKFAVLNVDEGFEVAYRFDYQAMPTTLAFEGGQLVGRQDGLPGYDQESRVRAFDRLTGRTGPVAG